MAEEVQLVPVVLQHESVLACVRVQGVFGSQSHLHDGLGALWCVGLVSGIWGNDGGVLVGHG